MYMEVRKIKLLDSSTLPMTLTRKSISFLGWIKTFLTMRHMTSLNSVK